VRARAAPALLAGLLVALAGCGDGGGRYGGQAPSASTPQPGRPEPGIDRSAAIAEARSAASQDAARQDYSIPPTAFAATCRAPGGAVRARAWDCAVRSVDRRCRGDVGLAITVRGVVIKSRVRVRCSGDSTRG
jgi:hypothetical protein